jgi:hyperosmotically inducible periplasmic protein
MRGAQATPFVESIHPGRAPGLEKTRRTVMVKHIRGLAGVVALVMLASLVAGCKTTTSAGRQIDDAAIKTAVKAKLAADVKLSTLTNIEVNSTNGIVTLAGQVDNPDQKKLAADVARSVDGVVRVNNELQVKNR